MTERDRIVRFVPHGDRKCMFACFELLFSQKVRFVMFISGNYGILMLKMSMRVLISQLCFLAGGYQRTF